MRDDVFGNLVEAFFSRDEVVFSGELTLQLGLLILIQFGLVDDRRDVVGQVLIGQLEFRDSILVVERNRVAVIYRLLEVVD